MDPLTDDQGRGGQGGEGLDDVALAAPATAAALSRAARRAWAVVALGAVGLVAAVGLAIVMVEADAELRAVGVRTSGTILQIDLDYRETSGGASVRFTVEGAVETGYVDLGGYATDYVEGQKVTVLYDPREPDRLTIDDVDYQSGWTTLPMVFAVVGTILAGFFGVWLVWAHARMRRLLRAQPWTPVRVHAQLGDRRAWFTTADGSIWRSQLDPEWEFRTTWDARDLTGPRLPAWDPRESPSDQSAWWVHDGATAVLSADKGASLVRARRRHALPHRLRRLAERA